MDNVTKWLMKVSGSEATRNNYQLRINTFSSYMKETHNIDIKMLKDAYREAKYKGEAERERFIDKLHDAVEDYVCFVKTQNYTNMHVKAIASIVSSYLKKGCGIKDIEVDIPRRAFPQFHNRDITKEEIKKLLEHATLRDRTFFLMMVESSLRPSTLLKLRYRYIKQDYEKNVIPMKIELPSELLKDRIPSRWAFIGEDGVNLLREYLTTRNKLNDNDYIFLPERPGRTKASIPSESALSNKFNKLVLKLGLDTPIEKGKPKSLRLYSLRKYFFNNMKCDSAFRNYWFCHKSVDDHYISTQEEKHREEYLKGYKFLRVFEPGENVKLQAITNELQRVKKQNEELGKENTKLRNDLNVLSEDYREIKKDLQELGDVNIIITKEFAVVAAKKGLTPEQYLKQINEEIDLKKIVSDEMSDKILKNFLKITGFKSFDEFKEALDKVRK